MSRATSSANPDADRAAEVLRALQELESGSAPGEEYTILKLSEPILSAQPSSKGAGEGEGGAANRRSDVSTASLDSGSGSGSGSGDRGPTPASLEADLAHYRELFAKLRFSYVEQVTKEKFIRAIVGDPPLIVTPHEIAELEAANAHAKAALKARKTEVAGMVDDLERRARDLARRYADVRAGRDLLRELPGRIAELEERVRELRARQHHQQHQQQEDDDDGAPGGGRMSTAMMNMPLGKTRELVEQRRRELGAVERELEVLGAQAPRKRKEMERLGAEVAALENRRANSTAAAREAKRRRDNNAQGGVADELEARGRWYRASEAVLRQVLDLPQA
ncbi:hypothetical protein MYCTH_75070 [Thermothelomyces thermophilus ATCC 42464]|uniref:Kinetochore protein Sos7 coiled-coil domain-containing protein n=1 Tax=Thermothelomyces thermophilus (strain ATCC 42464 / BCRC 31852 / DSM 1799) TaxID=573729 RepID=G2Q160_THET4|nr:uncharacterized protein MYCTH_75070 [Thermothelomyces thermophilus ATCC 42464]AEO54959.1 hypothetical protein MYCTH_75070 [Thermothelomyces thermophilus ATCC 42464]